MEAAAIDPHLLVRLDSKSAPRARSFRERTEVRLLCVSDACALDALALLCLTISMPAPTSMRSYAKSMLAATYLLPFSFSWMRSKAEGKRLLARATMRAR